MYYAIDSKRQGLRTTGLVSEVKDWVDGPDGRRRPSDAQARDENTGMPLWDVEVLYLQSAFGRESNKTGVVRVATPTRPVVGEFAPAEFDRLTVEVRISKTGGLVEGWRAEGLSPGQPSRSTDHAKAAT
ncbi:MAG: hypothetical protein V9G15_12475 [Dermatophilaceae bacterium]